MAIAVFCNEVKGKSMLAFARDLDVQYKTAFVLAHKLREAMASSTHGLRLGGEGRIAEVDGAYFGGHIRPENLAANRIDRRLAENRLGNHQVVVVMRERGGRTLAQVFAAEADAVATARLRIAKGTTVHADENSAWDQLHATSAMRRINHQAGYSVDGPAPMALNPTSPAYGGANLAITIISPIPTSPATLRRRPGARISAASATVGRFTAWSSWRCRPSVDFCGYWQRSWE
jgi:hypothetical protein